MLNAYFDQVYCINLPSRADRLAAFTEQALHYGFEFQLFEACSENELILKDHFNMETNRQRMLELACKISHIRVLRDAKENGYGKILILEDDAQIVGDISTSLFFAEHLFDNVEWQMLYFGYSFYGMKESKIAYYDNLKRTTGCLTTHAYAVNCKYINDLLYVLDYRAPIDVLYRYFIHTQGKTFLMDPLIISQRAGYSDILGRDVDYKKLIK